MPDPSPHKPAPHKPEGTGPGPTTRPSEAANSHFLRELAELQERLIQEATIAVGMLEASLTALWDLDTISAAEILKRDDRIDREEVAIEEAVFRLMALRQPVARDFRTLAFILKVNSDIERVGDHACSIAKISFKLVQHAPFEFPTSLIELGQRVPIACHNLLRALLDQDTQAAKSVVVGDKTIDRLTKQLFDETVSLMEQNESLHAAGLLIYRVGRELERVGDLMTNIAEDIVYLKTGEIVRHEKKRLQAEAQAEIDRRDRG